MDVPALKKHCMDAKPADLASVTAAKEHLRQFADGLVQAGLVKTPIADNADVQGIISTFLGAPDIPHANAVHALVDGLKKAVVLQVANEIGQKFKETALDKLEGKLIVYCSKQNMYWIPPSFKPYMLDEDEYKGMLFGLLAAAGYKVNEALKYGNAGSLIYFTVSW
jgi:hypothetical protein